MIVKLGKSCHKKLTGLHPVSLKGIMQVHGQKKELCPFFSVVAGFSLLQGCKNYQEELVSWPCVSLLFVSPCSLV